MSELKARELRIGNLIGLGLTQWFEVDAVNILEFQTEGNCDPYKPVPITSEWLLKFGFEHFKCGPPIPIEHWSLDLDPEGKNADDQFVLFYEDGCLEVNTYGGGHNSGRMPHIKYVHQLQNLYFALTGEQLTIKP